MREILTPLLRWSQLGHPVALATVVRTWSSAPRTAGSAMLVGPAGTVVGSVSGGCVESDVYAVAEEVLGDGRAVLRRYEVDDGSATAVGLTCGGVLEVFVERIDAASFPDLAGVAADVVNGRPVCVATVVRHDDARLVGRRLLVRPDATPGPTVHGSLGGSRREDAITADARGLLAEGRSGALTYGRNGQRHGEGMEVFFMSFATRPRMLVFGATDFASAVARAGAFLGYRVTVCDARPLFATRARFPGADEIVLDWPHRYLRRQIEADQVDQRTVVCSLTHDAKFDVPLLELALRANLAYVGAMASRRTEARLRAALGAAGLSEPELAQLSCPIGLDLGGRTPEETAISVAAEIIARRGRHSGRPLNSVTGPIHTPVEETTDMGARA